MSKLSMPSVPYADSRIISTRITPEIHKALREVAASKDCAVAAVVKTAVENYLRAAR